MISDSLLSGRNLSRRASSSTVGPTAAQDELRGGQGGAKETVQLLRTDGRLGHETEADQVGLELRDVPDLLLIRVGMKDHDPCIVLDTSGRRQQVSPGSAAAIPPAR